MRAADADIGAGTDTGANVQIGDGADTGDADADVRGRRRSARLVLAVGVLLGVQSLLYLSILEPGRLGMDFEVYHVAAEHALRGEPFYGVAPADHGDLFYVYPPVTVLAFLPFAALGGWLPGFLALTALKVVLGLGTALLLIRYTERKGVPLDRLDRALIGGYVVASFHAVPSMFYGEVNLALGFLLTAGFVLLDEGRETPAGAAFGLVALVKVFPALLGLWLLRVRATRAVAAAVAVGGGLFALGVPLFGVGTTRAYVREAILPRLSAERFAGGLDPNAYVVTVRRPLSVLFPDLDPALLTLGALLVLAPPVAYLYRNVEGEVDRLAAICGTVIATLLFFPSLFIYLIFLAFPLVPLLYLTDGGAPRTVLVAGALLSNFAYTLGSVERFLAAVPLPAGGREAVLAVAAPVLTFGTPLLYGLLLLLAGCVLHAGRDSSPT